MLLFLKKFDIHFCRRTKCIDFCSQGTIVVLGKIELRGVWWKSNDLELYSVLFLEFLKFFTLRAFCDESILFSSFAVFSCIIYKQNNCFPLDSLTYPVRLHYILQELVEGLNKFLFSIRLDVGIYHVTSFGLM
mmetsp:Transcript_77172/g.239022  ORF Transcript_77172/g.239022 Transcript_77172/m.239022 type:complete len:133 (-) Transcript_77172:8-406(-)